MTLTIAVSARQIERIDASGRDQVEDRVVVEAPLEIRCAGTSLVVVMRTPGDDVDLARGLLFAEGVLHGPADAAAVRPADPATLRATEAGNVIELDLDPAMVASRWPSRSLYATSSCGVCGKTSITELATRAPAVRSAASAPASQIASLPDRLGAAQAVFSQTGGLHAAGAFSLDGELLAIREDVGRHNAVDKLVGWALVAGRLPASELILCVSGRLGFEIAHKAVVAQFPICVGISAPSSLAIDLAEQFQVTLCGFARGDRVNVYTHSTRIE